MTRFAFTIEFDGTPYMGWQRQGHGPTVQQAIEEAISRVTGEEAVLHAAGRTDAGVHALAMRAHVELAKEIEPFRLMEAVNAQLRPQPIAILACEVVADDWHARFSCIGREYVYRIANRKKRILDFDLGLIEEFFRAFTVQARLNLHIDQMYGKEPHHAYEAVFKGLARALRMACAPDPRMKGAPSTKGTL